MSQIHYCFIARDEEMIVFEAMQAKELTSLSQAQRAAFRREIRDSLHEVVSQADNESSSGFAMRSAPGSTLEGSQEPAKVATFNNFAQGFMSGELKLSVLSNTVYIGCVTDAGFSEDKAARLLEDLRAEFSKMYQGRLSLIKKQTNLTANVYDQPFKKGFQRIYDSYNTGISNKNLQLAFQKVDEVKDIAAKSVSMMVQNNEETEKLLHTSQSTLILAQDFKKNSEVLEKTMERQNFWMCSRKCLMIFGGIGAVILLIYIIIKAT